MCWQSWLQRFLKLWLPQGRPYISVIDGYGTARRGVLFGGFDGLRKAMRQHGNIDYANIWIGNLTWLKHKAGIPPLHLTLSSA